VPRFLRQSVPDVILVEPDVHRDDRGFFLETWQTDRYREGGIPGPFLQDNHSRSAQGVLRGLHLQVRHPQGKLVRCVEGEVFDVAVDVRPGSPTFGQWSSASLSAGNFRQLWIPPGFAHGFCVVSPHAQFEYKCTALYVPGDEITLSWDDPGLAIPWPVPEPILSDKDRRGLSLADVRERLAGARGDTRA